MNQIFKFIAESTPKQREVIREALAVADRIERDKRMLESAAALSVGMRVRYTGGKEQIEGEVAGFYTVSDGSIHVTLAGAPNRYYLPYNLEPTGDRPMNYLLIQDDVEREAKRLADNNRVEDAWRLRGILDRQAGRRPEEVGPYQEDYSEGYNTLLHRFVVEVSADGPEDNDCCYCSDRAAAVHVRTDGARWQTCADLGCIAAGEPA